MSDKRNILQDDENPLDVTSAGYSRSGTDDCDDDAHEQILSNELNASACSSEPEDEDAYSISPSEISQNVASARSSNIPEIEDLDAISLSEINQNALADIRHYYEGVMPSLRKLLTSNLSEAILTRLVDLINLHAQEDDWIVFVENLMGNPPRFASEIIAEIKRRAGETNRNPLYIALRKPLWENQTLADLISLLLKQNRFFVLAEIQPDVESCIAEVENARHESNVIRNTRSDAVQNADQELSDPKIPTCTEDFREFSANAAACEEKFQNSAQNNFESREESSADLRKVTRFNISVPKPNVVCQRPVPSTVGQKHISVFVPHSRNTVNNGVLQAWRETLVQDFNLNVTLMCDMEDDLENAGNELEILTARCNTVHFVLPYLTQDYMHDISIPGDDVIPFQYTKWNRIVYNWMSNDVAQNFGLNVHVKPVIPEGENALQMLTQVHAARISFLQHLRVIPKDTQQLVDNLFKTLQRYSQYFF